MSLPLNLAITQPDGKTTTVRFDRERISLGRSSDNDLCYPEDSGLSRQHLAFEQEAAGWAVRDLNSKNGTLVNGVKIDSKRLLAPGDSVQASRISILFAPEGGREDQTVVFSGAPEAGRFAETTTLDRLLAKRAGDAERGWTAQAIALMRAGRELNERRPLAELFEIILDLSVEAVGATRGVVLTYDQDQLIPRASRGAGFSISTTIRDRVVDERTSLLVRDALSEEAFLSRESIVGQNVRTFMAVPLQTDERVIGLIYVDSDQLVREFSADDLNLLTVMANIAAIRIERERLVEIEQIERVMEAELQQAAEIQRRFLPAQPPQLPGLELAGFNSACRSVGGDYYDFLLYPDGKVVLVIADVAGKGMPAALVMTNLQAKVQALADSPADPAMAVARLNRGLLANSPGNRFVTLFLAVLDPKTGELVYCNAGHNPPLLRRANGEVVTLTGGGPVLGLFPGLRFEQVACRMEPGGALLLFSDGVTEAFDPAREEFGEERLTKLCREQHEASAESIVDAVHGAVMKWIQGAPTEDDITVVAARWLG
jgi:phosphoserine phosphatase RsbU/P